MEHVDLFSGIGGFALAAKWTGFETIVFCEKDEFCQKVLKKHWPKVPIVPDIKDIIEETKVWREFVQNVNKEKLCQTVHIADNAIQKEHLNGEKEIQKNTEHLKEDGVEEKKMKSSNIMVENVSVVEKLEKNFSQLTINTIMETLKEEDINHKRGNLFSKEDCPTITKSYATTVTMHEQIMVDAHIKLEAKVDLLTAGVPCQPASIAGKRGGKTDARWLWPETFKAISLIKPTWCILENVCGMLSLEGGLAFEQVCLELENQGYEVQPLVIPAASVNAPHRRDRIWILANSRCREQGQRRQSNKMPSSRNSKKGAADSPGRPNSDAPDSLVKGTGNKNSTINDEKGRTSKSGRASIRQENGKIGTGRASAANQNAPDSEGRDSRKPTKQKRWEDSSRGSWEIPWLEVATSFCRVDDGVSNRVDRLKSLGNAIVPQVAAEIMKGIKMIEERSNNAK